MSAPRPHPEVIVEEVEETGECILLQPGAGANEEDRVLDLGDLDEVLLLLFPALLPQPPLRLWAAFLLNCWTSWRQSPC